MGGSRAWLVLFMTLSSLVPRAAASSSPADARRALDQVETFRVQREFAAMESLAAVVRLDVESWTPPDTALVVEAWNQICSSRMSRRMLSDTLAFHAGRRALDLLAAAPGAPDTLRVTAELHVGWIYAHTGRSPESLEHFAAALEVTGRHPGWDIAATGVQYELGLALITTGQIDSALTVLRSALAVREPLNIPRDTTVGDLRALIATAYERMERADLAEAEYAAAIRAHEERLGPDDPGMIVTLSRAAAFEFQRGNYSKSVDYNRRGLKIILSQPNPNPVTVLIGRLALAQGLQQLGDLAEARDTYALVMPGLEGWLGPSHPQVLSGWIDLAGASSQLGDTGRALEIYRHIRAVYAADSTLTEKLALASASENMAMILVEEAPSDSALALAEEADALLRGGGGGVELSIRMSALVTQLRIHGLRGEWDAADRVNAELQEQLDRYAVRENNMTDDIWVVRSEVAEQRGRPAEAVAAAAEGARAARERLTWNVRALSDRQALLLATNVSGPLDRLLKLTPGSDPQTIDASWDELVRTRGLVGAEISRRRVPPASADPSMVRAHNDWVQAQEALARQEVLLASSLHDAEAESVCTALQAEVDECERRLVRDASATRPDLHADAIGLDAVLARLAPGQALVGFASAPGEGTTRRLFAFVAPGASRALRCLDLGPTDSLAVLIEGWKATLGEPDPARRSEAECRRRGALVAAAVWSPIAAAAGECADLLIVPEAPVTGLPWGALPQGEDRYLVEAPQVIHVLDAERELVAPAEAPSAGGLLAVGGVDFDEAAPELNTAGDLTAMNLRAGVSVCDSLALSRLDPLPGTAAEVRDVQAAWSRGPNAAEPATVLEGSAAGEVEFKRLAPGRRLLHIATHGLALLGDCDATAAGTRGVGGLAPVEPEAGAEEPKPGASSMSPAASVQPSSWIDRDVFLAFAGAARARQNAEDENEGLLTAPEVATLDLRGVEWVVLSACRSAAGENWSRQGVLGMERAFRLAGARTVIASQWSVDDAATRDWMRALYEARAAGAADAGAAMSAADREILRTRRSAGLSTHPFTWAAFTANGK